MSILPSILTIQISSMKEVDFPIKKNYQSAMKEVDFPIKQIIKVLAEKNRLQYLCHKSQSFYFTRTKKYSNMYGLLPNEFCFLLTVSTVLINQISNFVLRIHKYFNNIKHFIQIL